jgi:ATP-binding cassette, subfamily B, bacterial PglK
MLKLLNTKEKKSFYLMILLFGFFSFLEVLNLSLILPILENLLNYRETKSDYLIFIFDLLGENFFLYKVMTLFLGIVLFKNIYLLLITYYQNKFLFDFKFKLTDNIFSKIISSPYNAFVEINSSSYVKNLIGDTSQITQCIGMLIILYSDFLVLFFVFCMLLFVDFYITLIAFSILVIATLIYYKFFKIRFKELGNKRYIFEENIYKILNNTLGSFIEINLLNKKKFFKNYFSINNRNNNEVMRKYSFLQSIPRIFFELISVIIIVFYFIYEKFDGDFEIQSVLPKISLFVICLLRLMPIFNRITVSIQNIRFGRETSILLNNQMKKIENKIITNKNNNNNISTLEINKSSEIIISKLSYNIGKKIIINEIGLNFKIGEKIGLYGPSGSGKTTFLKIFSGLINPSSGLININGKDIFQGLRQWQDNISYLKQDNFIMDDTIIKNICFDDENINYQRLDESIKKAEIKELIDSLSDNLDTRIGENGHKISGGEKQRLCIARALYHEKKIIILDEPTSALDQENEKSIIDCINDLDDKLIILVSHKKNNFNNFDKIVHFNNGNITIQEN